MSSTAAPSVCPVEADRRVFNDANRVAGLLMFIAGAVYFSGTLAWWMRRSNHPYLRARSFALASVAALGFMFQMTAAGLTNFIGRDQFPCDVTLWLSYMVLPFGALPLTLRVLIAANRARVGQFIADATDVDDFDPQLFLQGSLWARLVAYARSLPQMCSGCKCVGGDEAGGAGVSDVVADAEAGSGASGRRMPKHALGKSKRDAIMYGSARSMSRRDLGRAVFFQQTNTFLALALFVLTSPVLVYAAVVSADSAQPFGGKGCFGCTLYSDTFVPILVEGCIVLVLGVGLLVSVRNADDPLGVLHEVRVLWGLGCVYAFSLLLSQFDPGSLRANGSFDWIYIGQVALFAAHTVQVTMPVLQTYKLVHRRESDAHYTLERVLADSELRGAFQQYLVAAFSVENLVFVDNVARWREQHADLPERDGQQRASELYDTFIREGSMLEVNISSTARRKVRATLDAAIGRRASVRVKPSVHVFDEVYDEVWTLLETDSFPRFLGSKFMQEAKLGAGRTRGKSAETFTASFGSVASLQRTPSHGDAA